MSRNNDELRDDGLPHIDVLKRVAELQKSGKLEKLKAAVLDAGAGVIKSESAENLVDDL